jgi:micrococcal nuclease
VWICGSAVIAPYTFAQSTKWLTPTAPVVSWANAGNYVGQDVAVEGTVVYTYFAASSGTTFLDFHYPYQGYFYGVIFSSDSGSFRCTISQFYLNKEVRITGTIQLYKGAPEIIVRSPSQIEVAYQGLSCL